MDPIRMGLQRCIKWEGETRYKEIEKNRIKEGCARVNDNNLP